MAMLKGGNELFANIDEKILSSTKKVMLHSIEFKESSDADNEASKIYSKYKPINSAYSFKKDGLGHKPTKPFQRQASVDKDSFHPPKVILYPPEKIQMSWKDLKRIGPGFANLGNTCFLNSVLQVLTYTAPLVNFINSDAHRNNCVSVGFCMLCEFRNHIIRVSKHQPQNGPIRPMSIIQRLSCISKNFKFGRQEDAHEFLRYVIEALRKSCLVGKTNLDRLSKETTAINQIFGGFFRGQVTCLSCKHTSSTYDPMMELNLDLKESNTVQGAMKRTIRTEKLDGENKYLCEKCNRKTPALKRCNIHIAPKILTLQLKRFDFQRLFGGKISKDVQFPETLDLGPFMSTKSETPVLYKLYAVLVHSGISCNSGHYYCYVKAPNGTWYEMNDSRVSQVGLQTVLRAQAYLLFYAISGDPCPSKIAKQEIPSHVKSNHLNIKSTPSPARPSSNVPKDIGISIVRKEPRIVPLSANRDKVNFSLASTSKNKIQNNVKENAKTVDAGSSQSTKNGTKMKSPSVEASSLDAIKKEYDSSESENDTSTTFSRKKNDAAATLSAKKIKNEHESTESSTSKDAPTPKGRAEDKKPAFKPANEEFTRDFLLDIEARLIATPTTKHAADRKSVLPANEDFPRDILLDDHVKEHSDDKPTTPVKHSEIEKDSTSLSTPKSLNRDTGNHKRKPKIHVGMTPPSKWGKWVPVKGLGSGFTPRAVLHRSLSDTHAFDKHKPDGKDLKRQMSTQVPLKSPAVNGENGTRWNVRIKDTPETPYGPMTPPVKMTTPDDRIRERTSSVTSETGSIPTKTGEWDVHGKDLEDTLAPPYVPERHFAGWNVKNTAEKESGYKNGCKEGKKDSIQRKGSDQHDEKMRDRSDDRTHKEKRDKRRESIENETKKHKKAKKRRKSAKLESDEEMDTDCSPSKKRRSENGSSDHHKSKKKSKKGKKKKKHHSRDDSDDEGLSSEKQKKKTAPCNVDDPEGSQKKHARAKLESSPKDDIKSPVSKSDKCKVQPKERKEMSLDENELEDLKRGKKKKNKKNKKKELSRNEIEGRKIDDDDGDSRYTAVKTPRRVSFVTLEEASNRTDKQTKKDIKNKHESAKEKKKKMASDSSFSESNQKIKSEAPVKKWDEAPKKATSWNGSNDKSVLTSLLSKVSKVETWDDESSATMRFEVEGSTKRSRDRWDDEYDEGKVKKFKRQHSHSHHKSKDNLFQKFQNRRNHEKNNAK